MPTEVLIPLLVMLTGHRVVANQEEVLARLVWIIEVLTRKGYAVTGICGGAKGADTLWAKACHMAGVPFKLFVPNNFYFGHYKVPEAKWLIDNCDGEPQYCFNRTFEVGVDWNHDNKARNTAMVKAAGCYIAVSNLNPQVPIQDRSLRGGTNDGIRKIVDHGTPVDGAVSILWIDPANAGEVMEIKFPKG